VVEIPVSRFDADDETCGLGFEQVVGVNTVGEREIGEPGSRCQYTTR